MGDRRDIHLESGFIGEIVIGATWPAIRDGVMALNHAQFEALFSGLDWRKVRAVTARPPTAAE
ncbi:hypothetical protein [Pseudophaeobacter leonis]|uniref:hypothetical protein n=1 Tax=Pseudophaeobacter leonis TaxID=1144477 RepID=UPI0009F4F984|nr:hypothetical protein [Pseudophaeobacter leonis]